jgi:type II secretory ATPase GspE/PulE/Tfp pilus assembly ATPase PilB-like protein/FixJ family two-component response regulator
MARFASLFLNDEAAKSTAEATAASDQGPAEKYKILFVDDEANVLKAMRRIFRQENFELLLAESGAQALALLEKHQPVHVVVSDHRMPGMAGTDLLKQIKAGYPKTIRIMLTGYADTDAVMGAVNEGAVYKFITKPWNDDDLRLTVGLALEQYDLIRENTSLKKQAETHKKELKQLSRFVNAHRSQLGNILVKAGLIDQATLEKALSIQSKSNTILPKILVNLGAIDERTILKAIEKNTAVNRVAPADFQVPEVLASLIPKEICEKNILLPLKRNGQKLIVVMADPTDLSKIDDLSFITGMPVQPVMASSGEILEKIKEVYGEQESFEEALSEIDFNDPTEQIEIVIEEADEGSDIEELLRAKDKPPAIRIVNAIISDALRHGASDVHIEPKNKFIMVRYRIDDLLVDKLHIPLNMQLAIVSRIKVMSDLDIAERRRPQDGRITVKSSTRMVDMRISTLPTINGEKVVLRILDKNAASKEIEELGFTGRDLTIVSQFIERPQGIILATGPTGSGKTTSLYGLLRKGAKITKNFTTIEDPVEYHMGMAEQVNVRDKIGLSFSTILRAILRQDPNVIMLGEIRDHETAEVAFHAALTGHLVLSTLHTNSSIASITRLRDMGIESYVISDALVGVIAQRLVRCICPKCKTEDHLDPRTLLSLNITDTAFAAWRGAGCDRCNGTGYKGRIAVYEIFQVDHEIKRMIHRDATEPELLHAARLTGMTTLLDNAVEKIKNGTTTCEEVLRVFGPQNANQIPCMHCGALMEQRHPFCPYCGKELIKFCRECSQPLAQDWTHCPRCGLPCHASSPKMELSNHDDTRTHPSAARRPPPGHPSIPGVPGGALRR